MAVNDRSVKEVREERQSSASCCPQKGNTVFTFPHCEHVIGLLSNANLDLAARNQQ